MHKFKYCLQFLNLIPCFCFFSIVNANSKKYDSVRNYYMIINNAELKIIDADYSSAKNLYKKAFEYKYPNGKDLYNAFLVSYYTVDTLHTIQYFKELSFKGLKKDYFIDTLSNISFWNYVVIKSNYDSCLRTGYSSYNKILIERLDSLLVSDQSCRKNGNPTEGMSKIDQNNVNNLISIVKLFGWPDFKTTGFWIDGSSPENSNIPFLMVMWHNKWTSNTFDNIAIEAVKAGNLRPDEWGTIILGRNMFGMKVFHNYDYFMNIWDYKALDPIRKKKINENRKEVNLENLDDYYKKFLYQSTFDIRFGSDVKKSMFKFLNGILVPTIDQRELQGLYNK